MTTRKSGRILVRIGVAAAVLLMGAVAVQPAATAEPVGATAAATVTPSTGLNDGDVVTVDASSLIPGALYIVGQCGDVGGGVFACNLADTTSVTASPAGTASSPLTVRRTFTGFNGDGSTWGTVDCDIHPCGIAIFTDSGDATGVSIFFA